MDMKQCAFGHFYDASLYDTCPYCNEKTGNATDPNVIATGILSDDKSPLADMAGRVDMGVTVPLDAMAKAHPVVGWLVCVKGPDMGSSYEIHNENNFIGRSEAMDINIRNDLSISRDKPLLVTYDSDSRTFYCGFMGGHGIVRLNKKPLISTEEIHARDLIEIGKTTLMFMPFCGPDYDWDWNELNKDDEA